jgi:hypothetical protein
MKCDLGPFFLGALLTVHLPTMGFMCLAGMVGRGCMCPWGLFQVVGECDRWTARCDEWTRDEQEHRGNTKGMSRCWENRGQKGSKSNPKCEKSNARLHKNGPQIHHKSTENRPKIDQESTKNRPRIDRESTENRPRIDRESTENRPRICPGLPRYIYKILEGCQRLP